MSETMQANAFRGTYEGDTHWSQIQARHIIDGENTAIVPANRKFLMDRIAQELRSAYNRGQRDARLQGSDEG